jgi:small subunit ribosomal protein S8
MDTIGDFLTVIRNGVKAGKTSVDVPSSNQRVAIANVLKKTQYVNDVKVVKDGKQGIMRVFLNYDENGKSKINGLRRMSRPGRRYYVNAEKIPNVRSGYGLAIVSTNKGVLSGGDAKQLSVGGELVCIVW